MTYSRSGGLKAKIKTGRYTGDGSTGLAITGLGFTPKMVMVWQHATSGGYINSTTKMDQMYTEYSFRHFDADEGTDKPHGLSASKIISLDGDGFTVDDGGANNDPNTDTVVYDYIAFG